MTAIGIAPSAILAAVNQSGSVSSIDEDPASNDGLWLVAADNQAATEVRVAFPSPPGDVSGTQTFRALVRRDGGTGTPTARIELWENGALVSQSSDTGITSTGTVISFAWSGSLVAVDGAGVEAKVVGTAAGGSPSKRATIDVGAIRWDANYTTSVPAKVGSVAISGGGAVASSGWSARSASTSLSSGGAVSASGLASRLGSTAISGGGSVVATGSQLIERFGSALISAGGVIAAVGRKGATAIASLSGGGTIASVGTKRAIAASTASGGGSVASSGSKAGFGATSIAAGGNVASSGLAQRFAQAVIHGGGIVTAIGYRVGQVVATLREGTAALMGVGR